MSNRTEFSNPIGKTASGRLRVAPVVAQHPQNSRMQAYDLEYFLELFEVFREYPRTSEYSSIKFNFDEIKLYQKENINCEPLIKIIFPSIINIVRKVFKAEESKAMIALNGLQQSPSKFQETSQMIKSNHYTAYPSSQISNIQDLNIFQPERNSKSSQYHENTANTSERQSRRQASNPHTKRKSSVGLRNKGLTCFINSVIQMIAHLPIPPEQLGNDSLRSSLTKLVNSMNKQDRDSDSNLESFLSLLNKSSEFQIGKQGDPKYLIIHIFQKNPQLITWERQIEFMHSSNRGNHIVDFPKDNIKFFQVPYSSYNDYRSILENTIKNTFLEASSNQNLGFCERCNENVYGKERVKFTTKAKILMFNFSTSGISISIKEVKSLNISNTCYELYCIIQRDGYNNLAHNLCVCRESDNEWVEYNDNLKQPFISSAMTVHNVYILVYAEV